MVNIKRKKHIGEPGNGGEFAADTRTEDTVALSNTVGAIANSDDIMSGTMDADINITSNELRQAKLYVYASMDAYNVQPNNLYKECVDSLNSGAGYPGVLRDAAHWLAWGRANPGVDRAGWQAYKADATEADPELSAVAAEELTRYFATIYEVPEPHVPPEPGLYLPEWGGSGYRKVSP